VSSTEQTQGILAAAGLPRTAPALRQQDFVPLSLAGFGDGWNAYIHSMTWYGDHLYCGTFRANMCLKRRQTLAPPQWPVWPVRCPEDAFELDLSAEIWRFSPATAQWERVLKAPVVEGRDGGDVPREIAYRGMVGFQGKSDSKPALYVGTFATTRAPGPQILRSENGRDFQPVCKPGMGYDGISSFRFLVPFKGKLYTSPVGSTRNIANESKYPMVLESEDPASGEWREVSAPGFGDPNNTVIFNVASFNGFLYAGTFNHVNGCQIWKSDCEGPAPYEWKKVLGYGAYRGQWNEGVLSMLEFNGALYIGTCIQDGGYDRVNKIGPAASELLRINPDDSWEIIVGSARVTPKGISTAKSGIGPGFNDLFNGYFWRMCVHDGRLYVGTMSWIVYLRYVARNTWPARFRELVDAMGLEETISREGGFDLWCSEDGEQWTPVTTTGFGNPFNAGARSLVSTPYGLAVGSINPFGPEVAVQRDGSWVYEKNPRGGAEVWLGAPALPANITGAVPAGGEQDGSHPAESYRLPPAREEGVRQERLIDLNSTAPVSLTDEQRRRFDLPPAEIDQLGKRIDVLSVVPDSVEQGLEFYDLRIEGEEKIPSRGPVLLVGNNPVAPMFAGTTFIPEHVLFTLNQFAQRLSRPVRHLASLRYYESPERTRMSANTLEKLGYLPGTLANGLHVLRAGGAALVYPEDGPSIPPYQLRKFSEDFARMALEAGAVIVPVIFIGPHESHLLVEHGDLQVPVNRRKPRKTDYLIRVLKPLPAPGKGEDPAAIAGRVRDALVAAITEECAERPGIGLARKLQRLYGEIKHE